MTSRKPAIAFIFLLLRVAVKTNDDVISENEDEEEGGKKADNDVERIYDTSNYDNYDNYKDVEVETPKIKIKGVDATPVISAISALVAVLKYALGAVELANPAAFAALGPIFLGVVGLVNGVVVPNVGALAVLIQGLIVFIQAAIGVITGNPGMGGISVPVVIIGLILVGPATVIIILGLILEILRAFLAIIPIPQISITVTIG